MGVETYGKMGENTQFGHFSETCTGTIEVVPVQFRYWSFLAKFYQYNLRFYRYNCHSVPSFDQFWYFSHNLLISYPI